MWGCKGRKPVVREKALTIMGYKKKSKEKPTKGKKKPKQSIRFVTEYVNRWGQPMRASDYGYVAWPFPAK